MTTHDTATVATTPASAIASTADAPASAATGGPPAEAEAEVPQIIDPDPVGSAASDAARGSRRGLVDRRWFRVAVGGVLPAALLVAWQVASTSGSIPASRLPSPQMVWDAGADLVDRGDLGEYVAISTQRVLTGFAFGAGIGVLLGAVVGLSRLCEALLSPLLGALRAVPSLAWVPLLILWFKIGEESKIILITIGAFFPMYTIVSAALRHVDRHLLEAGRAFGYHGVRLFAVVQLPAVIPSVISGFRLALAQAWLFLVAAELIAASEGLGFLLSESGNNGRIDRLFLAIVVLALLGKATDSILSLVERLAIRRWG
jgi:sulfonate transport system permease protein